MNIVRVDLSPQLLKIRLPSDMKAKRRTKLRTRVLTLR